MPALKAVVNRGLCMGVGECVHYAPEVFHLDDDQKSVAGNGDGGDEKALRVAAASCPNFAIKLVQESAPSTS
jgi:ferredoxin